MLECTTTGILHWGIHHAFLLVSHSPTQFKHERIQDIPSPHYYSCLWTSF